MQQLKELEDWQKSWGAEALDTFEPGAAGLSEMNEVMQELANRLKGNYPFHHPAYAGQMLKPPHPVTQAAYMLAMTINPNNHALDGGPPTSEMEKEIMAQMAAMVGYGNTFLGHLTSGGTTANLEALWIARQIHPGKAVAFSAQAHYTHQRMCEVLNIEAITIPCTPDGIYDLNILEEKAADIGTLVVTMGTTGLGMVEPLAAIVERASEFGFRIHLDAAYGGFFKLIESGGYLNENDWKLTGRADSIVIDPHKHGLQPYGCGSVLFKDAGVGRFYKHDSPYTYFTSDELHLGEISLECSRSGAAAAALWATLRLFPLEAHKGMGPILAACRKAGLLFWKQIQKKQNYRVVMKPELDIVGYFPAPPSPDKNTTADISRHSNDIFTRGMNSSAFPLYLSLYKVPSGFIKKIYPGVRINSQTTTILRSVLMKPEHAEFIAALMKRLDYHY